MILPPLSFFSEQTLEGKIIVIHYDGSYTLDGAWDDVVVKTSPTNATDILIGIAVDNSISAEIDIWDETKSIMPSGETMNTQTFPGLSDYRLIGIKLPHTKWRFKAYGTSGNVLKYDILIYRYKGVVK